MPRLNAIESDIETAKVVVDEVFDGNVPDSVATLFECSEMGMRSFRTLSSLRPLIAALWKGMSENGDPNRFAVERMIKDIDQILGYWVVPDDEGEIEVKEGDGKK